MELINFIVVRFSLKLSDGWQKKAYGDEANREKWLIYRYHIFLKTIYTSALRQTIRPHKLLLLLDEADAEVVEKHFRFDDSLVQPIFSRKSAPYEAGVEYIRNTGLKNIVVSRADSDDVISDDYIENVNAEVERMIKAGRPLDYVVATHGYRTDGDFIQEFYYSCSPYLSLYRDEWDNSNIYDISHEDVLRYAHSPIENARWMQCIHGGNLANKFVNGVLDREIFEKSISQKSKIVAMRRVSTKESWPENFGTYNFDFPKGI